MLIPCPRPPQLFCVCSPQHTTNLRKTIKPEGKSFVSCQMKRLSSPRRLCKALQALTFHLETWYPKLWGNGCSHQCRLLCMRPHVLTWNGNSQGSELVLEGLWPQISFVCCCCPAMQSGTGYAAFYSASPFGKKKKKRKWILSFCCPGKL